jgi:glycosyltransferase involved in cell wall biosynthesis
MGGSQILIVSRIAPDSVGGLASYQRHLAAELSARGLAEVTFFGSGISRHPLWGSLASRPRFLPILEGWIELTYHTEIEALAERGFRAVHYVGTGWDFIGFAAHAVARKSGAPFTIWPAVHPRQWGDDYIDLRLYRLANTVFTQTHHEAAHLESRGLPVGNTVRCGLPPMCQPNGCGKRLRGRLALGEKPLVFFLGARGEPKGYPILLKAWKQVLASVPEAVLLLAGPGGEEYAPLLAELPAGSVYDFGVINEADKADAYAACDLFCLPSAHESFGIVFAEAWSYGKPVICGPAPAPREWISNGETGLHCEQTTEAVTEAILHLLRNPSAAQRMGSAGKHFQQGELTWETVVGLHSAAFGLSPLAVNS